VSVLKRGATGVPTKAYPILSRIKGLKEVKEMLSSLRKFSQSEVAQERLRIINFYERFGEKATKAAFMVDRKLIWVWRKRLNDSQGRLESLVPASTRPKRVRVMLTDPKVVEFIRNLREKYPNLGKEKIKPLLDRYCISLGIQSISESTIGKVIKRQNLTFNITGRIYHNPNSKWAINRSHRTKRLRIRIPPKVDDFGHLQMDTVLKIVDGVRRYIYSAIDIKLKFAFSLPYLRLNSKNTLDFFKKLMMVYPFKIKSVQTDNGLEFLGVFDLYLKEHNIPHYFIYPRCCRINGIVERYQRTLQEEFIDPNLCLIHDLKLFTSKLADYLVFYLCYRPHKSLGLKSPLEYLTWKGGMSKKSVTYTHFEF